MRGRRPSRALRRRPLNCELEAHAGRVIRDIRSRGPILLDYENRQAIAQSVLPQFVVYHACAFWQLCVCNGRICVCICM